MSTITSFQPTRATHPSPSSQRLLCLLSFCNIQGVIIYTFKLASSIFIYHFFQNDIKLLYKCSLSGSIKGIDGDGLGFIDLQCLCVCVCVSPCGAHILILILQSVCVLVEIETHCHLTSRIALHRISSGCTKRRTLVGHQLIKGLLNALFLFATWQI